MMSQLSKKELMGAQKTPQETWAKKDLSRRSGGRAKANLGNLWTDLLKALTPILARDSESSRAQQRASIISRDEDALALDQPVEHRPLFGPGASRASAWSKHHQTRHIAKEVDPGADIHSLGRRKTWLSGNRPGRSLRRDY